MLHVIVEAVDAWDSKDVGVRESSSLLSSMGTRFRASSNLSDTLGVIGDRVWAVWNVFLIVPTQYGLTALVGVEGVASSPDGRGMRTKDRWRGVCSQGLFACRGGGGTVTWSMNNKKSTLSGQKGGVPWGGGRWTWGGGRFYTLTTHSLKACFHNTKPCVLNLITNRQTYVT